MRKDIHRPSAIVPEDYDYITCTYIGCKELDPGEIMANAENLRQLWHFQEQTGARYSSHEHGGTCHICGATALYLAHFHHQATNKIISVGEDCAAKLDMGDPLEFQTMKKLAADARSLKAGKNKAKAILADAHLTRAWELFDMPTADALALGALVRRKHAQAGDDWLERKEFTDCATQDFRSLCDIIARLIQYGSASDKQLAFLAALVDRIDNRSEREAERTASRKAEHDAAKPCPAGRVTFTARPLSVKMQYSQYGDSLKWLLITPEGWKVFGTVPAEIERQLWDCDALLPAREYGEEIRLNRSAEIAVTLTATVEPSKDDTKFGFYKRPTKPAVTVKIPEAA